MSMKNEARLTSSLLARKGSAQPFSAADVFSLPPQTVVTPASGMDERAEGRRPQPTGWSSSPVTPSKSPSGKAEATEQATAPQQPVAPQQPAAPQQSTAKDDGEARQQGSWTTQSIFSALKRTPGLHPAGDGAASETAGKAETAQGDAQSNHGEHETPRKVSPAMNHGVASSECSAASSARDRVALTLRVDQDRHTRLRVLAAQTKRSSQDILLAALDSYIDSASQGMTFCECLKPSSMCCKSS